MATLGYGMYGYNTLNTDGETDSLPFCTIGVVSSNQTGDAVAYFNELISDEYHMAVPNQAGAAGTYSTIRTPVSGLYDIEVGVTRVGQGGGAGVGFIQCYIDKTCNFAAATGIFVAGGAGSYVLADERIAVAASTAITQSLKRRVFLEKDCFVTIYQTGAATIPLLSASIYSHFSVRCISRENSGKVLADQTF